MAVVGWGGDAYCKGPGYGTANAALDAIPFVGTGRIVTEFIVGDFIPDLPDVEPPSVDDSFDDEELTEDGQRWVDLVWREVS